MRFSVKRRGGPSEPAEAISTSGAYRFTASGVFAADTTKVSQYKAATGRHRMISIDQDRYWQDVVRSKDGKYISKTPSAVGKWGQTRNLSGVM